LSTTQVSDGESLDAKSIFFNQYPGLPSPNGVPATHHPTQVQTPTILSENKAIINPTTSPTNIIENQSERQSSSLQNSVLPVGLGFGIFLE
jgi:hypothetical protein